MDGRVVEPVVLVGAGQAVSGGQAGQAVVRAPQASQGDNFPVVASRAFLLALIRSQEIPLFAGSTFG